MQIKHESGSCTFCAFQPHSQNEQDRQVHIGMLSYSHSLFRAEVSAFILLALGSNLILNLNLSLAICRLIAKTLGICQNKNIILDVFLPIFGHVIHFP